MEHLSAPARNAVDPQHDYITADSATWEQSLRRGRDLGHELDHRPYSSGERLAQVTRVRQ